MPKSITIFIVIIFVNCLGMKQDREAIKNIEYKIVKEGSYCGYDDETQLWIKTQEQWERCWETLNQNTVPQPTIPIINFDKEYLIACFMGTQSKGGYRIQVREIVLDTQTLEVDLVYIQPGDNCISTLALTQPYVIVSYPVQKATEIQVQNTVKKENC